VIEIIDQIGVQIAITLGLWAVSPLFPVVLATLEPYLSALVVEGSRALQLLAHVLAGTVRTLVEARNAIDGGHATDLANRQLRDRLWSNDHRGIQ